MSNSISGTDPAVPPPRDDGPPPRARIRTRTKWLLAATILGSAVAGLGAFTFGFARGHSYLTDDPAACANCHIMEDYYAAWQRGSHRSAATCNACHTPHNLVGKYATKAINGFWHSFYFTTGGHPDPIRIGTRNRVITERACRDCHQEITAAITPGAHVAPGPEAAHASDDAWRTRDGSVRAAWASTQEDDRSASCIRCHAAVGHWVR
jgi:cytochrome c nitrite reductase small subunit